MGQNESRNSSGGNHQSKNNRNINIDRTSFKKEVISKRDQVGTENLNISVYDHTKPEASQPRSTVQSAASNSCPAQPNPSNLPLEPHHTISQHSINDFDHLIGCGDQKLTSFKQNNETVEKQGFFKSSDTEHVKLSSDKGNLTIEPINFPPSSNSVLSSNNIDNIDNYERPKSKLIYTDLEHDQNMDDPKSFKFDKIISNSNETSLDELPSTSNKPLPQKCKDVGSVSSTKQIKKHVSGNPFLKGNSNSENKEYTKINAKDIIYTPKFKELHFLVKNKLKEIYNSGELEPNDIDERALESLNRISVDDALNVLSKFEECDIKNKINKSAYLCSIIKHKLGNQGNSNYDKPGTLISSDISTRLPKRASLNKPPSFISNNPILTNESTTFKQVEKPRKMDEAIQTETESFVKQEGLRIPSSESLVLDNINKLNPKIQTQLHRKNYIKPAGMKFHRSKTREPISLKQIEKVANKLSNCSVSNVIKSCPIKVLSQDNSAAPPFVSESDQISQQKNSYLGESIYQMKNLDNSNIEAVVSLQQLLVNNLHQINSFMSALNSCPVINEEIIDGMTTIKDQVTSFFTKPHISELLSKKNILSLPKLSENPLFQNLHTDPQTESTTATQNPSTDHDTVSLNTYKSLLNALPEEFYKEKPNISLKNTEIFCGICEKSIPFDESNLKDHLSSTSHKAMLKCKQKTGETLSVSEKDESIIQPNISKKITGNFELPPKYKGVLDVIYQSCVKGCDIDVPLYICRICDFITGEEVRATDHISNDENHVKNQQLSNAKWHFCESCRINLFGNNDHFSEHCTTDQHTSIMMLKNENQNVSQNDKVPLRIDPEVQELDCVSVSSSNSNLSYKGNKRLNNHEIFLTKVKMFINKRAGPYGIYCQICNRYTLYSPSSTYFCTSEKHILRLKFKDKLKRYECLSCHIHLFGDENILKEHYKIPLHTEITNLKKDKAFDLQKQNVINSVSIGEINEFPNEGGTHFELMKDVLKKHVKGEPSNSSLGFLCHLCEVYFLDEQNWISHLNNASHINRISSLECKKIIHKCLICNVDMICSENIFLKHQQSWEHQIVSKIKGETTLSQVNKNEHLYSESEEYSSDNDGSDENEDIDIMEEGSDSNSITSNENNLEKTDVRKTVPNGIHISGLPADVAQKDVFEVMKSFGFVKRVTLKNGAAQVIFSKNEMAENVVAMKAIFIKNKRCYVNPLFDQKRKRSRNKGKQNVKLNKNVAKVLQSQPNVEACIARLIEEVYNVVKHESDKFKIISKDLNLTIPGCKVHLFGSQVTGLATVNSDFDIYIDYDRKSFYKDTSQKTQEQIIRHLLDKFTRPDSSFIVKDTVLDARVPIIRVIHGATNTLCDISCRSGLSVENSQLVRAYTMSDSRVRWLVIAVKWWMQQNNLLDRSIFTSYATTWLVLFFLMRIKPEPVLCPVLQLQKNMPEHFIAHWDCRFNRNIWKCFKTNNRQSELDLLAQFFVFYKCFNYRPFVMCPLTADVVPRKLFDELQLPSEYILYKQKMLCTPSTERLRTTTPICLQDPFDLSHNITKGVSYKDLDRFKALCSESAMIFRSQPNNETQ